MPALDTDSLLEDLAPDAPSGADLSYDASYLELFRLAEGTAEQQIGDTVVAAEEPNWRDVRDRSVEILQKSRDLRVIVLAATAALRLEGIPGLAAGLGLLRGAIERHWDTLYPQLDPDDGLDPLERLNIIAAIAAPPETFGDTLRFRRRVREAPLSNSRQLGRFSLRDITLASGGNESASGNGESQPAVSMSVIDAAFEDTPVEELQQLSELAARAAEHIRAIEAALDERVGSGNAPSLDGPRQDLAEICLHLGRYLAKRGYGSADNLLDQGDNGEAGAAAGRTGGGRVSGGGGGGSGEIASTQDVLLAIDRICQYYERHEPSSPVPLLLKRAKRLVSKSFLDIINDLSPDALSQVKALGGIEDPE